MTTKAQTWQEGFEKACTDWEFHDKQGCLRDATTERKIKIFISAELEKAKQEGREEVIADIEDHRTYHGIDDADINDLKDKFLTKQS